MSHVTATRLFIRGRVQGVGYRAWLAREAERRGLRGWVRNRREGSVEALVFAPAPALEDFVATCRNGPPAANVSEVALHEETAPAAEALGDFAIRPSA
ncbi:acylphosphatase [Ancylobacter dichloromethanicus]|uniref:acylphosphatase n=1 Tax=Ancylobacter dichloromethanicus TaxID=518825 RepID=A0A9W6MZ57_9HYPH|nr:acylphosphatase [Ancylobacter dichloromethanicus]MBS7554672.1 acylphosphatase [Ancylobacter dichloromethanicus]GLK71803.1 acylphosphatase [Ancylobacter dichloromethanicus]